MKVSPEHLEAAREEAERLPSVEIEEVDLQWVQVHNPFHKIGLFKMHWIRCWVKGGPSL